MFESIVKELKETNANVFRIALYHNGQLQEHTLRPVCRCLNSYSVSKNFTATAIGIAQDMGMLRVSDRIMRYFLNDLPLHFDPQLPNVKIKHLLAQTTGIGAGFLFEKDRYETTDQNWVQRCLSAPLPFNPGEKFIYSNSNYYLLSCIIHRVSGLTLDKFLAKYLLNPMGIYEFAWEECPMGETMGATGLYLNTTDMAKLGILYLNKGVYNGVRLLSEEWVNQATANQVNLPDAPAYGYGFWLNDMGYHCGGAYNQVVINIPEHDLVFAAHAYMDDFDYFSLIKKYL